MADNTYYATIEVVQTIRAKDADEANAIAMTKRDDLDSHLNDCSVYLERVEREEATTT